MNMSKKRLAAVAAGAAVLVTLGGAGGAVAAALVTSADIKDYTIKGVDLHADSVSSSKIKDGGVKSADIANGTIKASDIASGVLSSGGAVQVSGSETTTAAGAGDATDIHLTCPSGKTPLELASGDYSWVVASTGTVTLSDDGSLVTSTDAKSTRATGVTDIAAYTSATNGATITAYIVCG